MPWGYKRYATDTPKGECGQKKALQPGELLSAYSLIQETENSGSTVHCFRHVGIVARCQRVNISQEPLNGAYSHLRAIFKRKLAHLRFQPRPFSAQGIDVVLNPRGTIFLI